MDWPSLWIIIAFCGSIFISRWRCWFHFVWQKVSRQNWKPFCVWSPHQNITQRKLLVKDKREHFRAKALMLTILFFVVLFEHHSTACNCWSPVCLSLQVLSIPVLQKDWVKFLHLSFVLLFTSLPPPAFASLNITLLIFLLLGIWFLFLMFELV